MDKKKKIAIIGYGRFGKLLSKMLSPYGDIFIVEKDEKKIGRKIKKIEIPDLLEMDWIILAVPISSLERVLREIKPHLRKGSVVMDVSSVKVYPARWLKKHLSKEVEILATHPMFGPDSAKKGLKGLKIVMCPVRISEKSMRSIEEIYGSLGLNIIRTTPEIHDREAAKSLSLVHFLGRALGRMKIGKQAITTLGYERLLLVNETVGNDTWQLFLDMHRYNPFASEVRKKFMAEAKKINEEING